MLIGLFNIYPFSNNHDIWSRFKSEVKSIEVFAGIRNARNAVNLNKLFYHPGWVKPTSPQAKKEHDIALLKLEKKYRQDYQRGNNYGLNTICLPNESKMNVNEENATFAGWGAINEQGTLPKRLQIAEAVLKPHRFCGSANLCDNFVGKQPRTCKVSFILKIYYWLYFVSNYRAILEDLSISLIMIKYQELSKLE